MQQKINYAISFTRPMSQGTRCHQLALYVLYDSPIQMLCDLPSHYYKEPLAMEFLSVVPAVWDETIPLFGKVGDYLGVARQSGDDYFLGVITDWSAREFDLNFDFLPDGEYELTAYHDGLNAERYAEDFASRTSSISRGDHKTIQLASGGGWVGVIKKIR